MNQAPVRKTLYLLATLTIAIAWSCGDVLNSDDYDFKGLEASPTMALPLAFGELSIEDIIGKEDSAFIKVNTDGLISLEYEQSLKTQVVKDLIQIPDKNNVTGVLPVPAGVLPPSNTDVTSTVLQKEITLDLAEEELTEILFKSGELNFDINMEPANPNYRYAVNITIPEFKDASTGATFAHELSGSGSLDISNQRFASTTPNQITINYTLIHKRNSNPVTIAPGTTVNVVLSFTNMDYSYVKGFFGDQQTVVPAETIEIEALGSALVNANDVSFAQPEITFDVLNDIGVPTKIYFSTIEARKHGSTPIPLQITPASPLTLNSPASMGNVAITKTAATNAKQVLDYSPSEFFYDLRVHINEGLTSGANFMADTSEIEVKMKVRVPLYGHASNMIMSDTLDIDLADAEESQIESAALRVNTSNEIPLDANVQIFLTDENFIVTETLLATPEQMNLIKGSTVTASGDLQSAGNVDNLINLDKAKLEKIFSASHIIIQARLSTSRDSAGNLPDVKFRSQYKMNIKLGLQAKLKINIDE